MLLLWSASEPSLGIGAGSTVPATFNDSLEPSMQILNGSLLLNALTVFTLGINSESDDFHNAVDEVRD